MRITLRWLVVGMVFCLALSTSAQEQAQEEKKEEAATIVQEEPATIAHEEAATITQEEAATIAQIAGPVALRYAEIEISGPVVEMLPDMYLFEPDIDTLYDLVGRIDQAREDDSIHGVIIKLDGFEAGWAKAQELRQAIFHCREAGKEVVCYMSSGGNVDYYLASASERVLMPPSGSLYLVGVRAEVLFLKGLLDKVGVKGDIVQIGESKGAAEPYTRTTCSEAFRESINALLDDYCRQLVEGIASGRKMKAVQVRALIDQGPFTAKWAKEAGLVDGLMFYDELLSDLKRRHGRNILLAPQYWKQRRTRAQPGGGAQQFWNMLLGIGPGARDRERPVGPAIAVIYAVGPIVSGEPDGIAIGESIVSAERMTKLIRKARADQNIKAIVLRVDSPGGSAQACDLIWHELRRADETKPVIVSLSDVAGSGGYYIAAGGRKIYADAATITGSIGVVGGKFVLKGLFEKVGLSVEVFERGENAGLFSSVEEFSDVQRERFHDMLEETYETFLERIMATRKQPLEDIKKMAQGQTWTGHQARLGKLVDEIGGLNDAIAGARKAAGLGEDVDVAIVRMPKSRSLFETIIFGRQDDSQMPFGPAQGKLGGLPLHRLPRDLRPALRYLNALLCLQNEHTAALMPGFISIR